MGLFETILGALVRLICGPPQGQQPPPEPPAKVYYGTVQIPTRPKPRPQQEHRPRPHGQSVSPGGRIDQNLVNQSDEYYKSLRARANEEGDGMAKCFEESHQAYNQRDGALAKELSNKGKRHQAEMERLNREASEWIFTQNNKDSGPNEVDLHGLYVKEAIAFTERSIQEAQSRGDSEIHLIVGKGLHSKNGAAKIKPAIEELVRKYNLVAQLDPSNGGVLIVSLDGRDHGTGRIMQPDDLARGIERQTDGCFIM